VTSRVAQCACRAVSLRTEGEPALNAICHCDNCKRRTGSAFGWSAYFKDAAIQDVAGPLSRFVVPVSYKQERFFCERCGTTLYWKSEARILEGLTGVAAGCFAESETPLPPPTYSASHSKSCAWVSLPAEWKTSG
jgi:hypothetical protein